MPAQECLFCQIAKGESPSSKVWEDAAFLAIRNKYPIAPIHLLVLPKEHIGKQKLVESGRPGFWEELLLATVAVIKDQGLQKTGYKLVNNGAGYNHFDHEHMHVLGGTSGEPGGQT